MSDPNDLNPGSAGPARETAARNTPGPDGSNRLMQRLSSEFITAQNSMERSVVELRAKLRASAERLRYVLEDLEENGLTARVDRLSGIGEEGMAIERLSRQLKEQKEDIEKSIDAARSCSRRGGG